MIDKPGYNKSVQKPKKSFFPKFSIETLFYMFYYMPRDSLQIFAADELYKRKWRFHVENHIWFLKNEENKESKDDYSYFHPQEWKIFRYIYGKVDTSKFLSESEVGKYRNFLNY